MRKPHVSIYRDGQNCRFAIDAQSIFHAQRAHKHADENPPNGYITLFGLISRRKSGGQRRHLILTFDHTGNKEHPPMVTPREWVDTLEEEVRLCQASE